MDISTYIEATISKAQCLVFATFIWDKHSYDFFRNFKNYLCYFNLNYNLVQVCSQCVSFNDTDSLSVLMIYCIMMTYYACIKKNEVCI